MTITTYQIEKGVAIPARNFKKSRYPFNEMDVGDSFIVPITGSKRTTQTRLSASAASYSRYKQGRKFTVRVVENGFRVWRTA